MASALHLIESVLATMDTAGSDAKSAGYVPHASDVLQINNCISRFLLSLDEGDGEGMAGLFVSDGKCEILKISKTFTGRAAILALCGNLHAKFKTVTHFESNICISFQNAASATNVSYWKGIDGHKTVSYGRHKDVFVKDTHGQWRFASRVDEHIFS